MRNRKNICTLAKGLYICTMKNEQTMKNSTEQILKLIEFMTSLGMMDNLSNSDKEQIIFEIQLVQMQSKRDTIEFLKNELNISTDHLPTF